MSERLLAQRRRSGWDRAARSWGLPATAWAGADGAARVSEATRSGGRPLEAGTRNAMESSFGHNFSQVRVHADGPAAGAAEAIAAAAFTIGSDIFVRADRYAPDSPSGYRLLAHELTHVVQHERFGSPGFGTGRDVSQRGDAAEREAEGTAHLVAGGHAVQVSAAPSAPVERGVLDWVEDKASGAWDTATGAASAVGGVAADAASAVGSAASAAYQGYEKATDFHQLTNALDTGVDWVEKQAAAGGQKAVEETQDIPILGQLAKASAFIGTEATDLTGGLVKGAGDVVGGLGNAMLHPIDAAAGMEGILEHNSTIPFMGSTLKAAHGLYDLAANGGGQYGSNLGDLANHVFNPLQQMQDDANYDSDLARGILTPGAKTWDESWQRVQANPMDTLGRAAANIAPMVMGAGEAGLGEDAGQVTRVPEPRLPGAEPPPTLRTPYAPPGVPEPAPFNPDITGPTVEPQGPAPARTPGPTGPEPGAPAGPTTYKPTGSRGDWAWDPQQYPGDRPPSTPPGFEGQPRPFPAPRTPSPLFPDQLPDFGVSQEPAPPIIERPVNPVLQEPPSSALPAPDTIPGGPEFPQPAGTPVTPQPIPKLPGGPKVGPPIPREEPPSVPPGTVRQPMDIPSIPAEEPLPSTQPRGPETQPAPASTGGSETPTLRGLGGLPAIPRGFDPGAVIQLLMDRPGAGSVVQLMQDLGMPLGRA